MILKRLIPLSIVLCFLLCSVPSARANTPLRVLSWNIQFGQGTDGVTNFDRIATWLARMNPDVIALCEMPPDKISTLVGYLNQKTGRVWNSHFVPKAAGIAEGNLILSTYSFVSVSSRYLSFTRSIAQVTINVGGTNVNIFATHLDHTSSSYRLTEANELVDWTSGFATPRIVAGDMNAGNDTPEVLRLLQAFRDSWVDSLNLGAALAYPDNPVWLNTRTRRWRIDYILYSADLNAFTARGSNIPDTRDLSNTNVVTFLGTSDDKGVRPSDHNLFVTDFDVVSATAPAPAPAAVPVLLAQGSTSRALAIHSTQFTGEPFPLWTEVNLSDDHRTRIMLFATNLDFLAGETVSSVTARGTDSRGFTYDLPVEQVNKVSAYTWLSEVIVRLPDDQTISGDLVVTLSMHGGMSNAVRVAIKAP
jgi:endonuclease/exonuclease/phosphatase family metal-dependent hydrolase